MDASAVVPQGADAWYKLFDALQYVDNPYALLAYLFLVVVVALGFLKIPSHIKGISLALLAVMILGTVGLLLNGSLSEVERHSMIPLVNEDLRRSAEVAPGVTISLIDATSFRAAIDARGGGGQSHNRTFPLGVWRQVFLRASILSESPARAQRKTQDEWNRFLATLTAREEEKVLTISFVRLQVSIDGRQVQDRFWFRGDIVQVRASDGRSLRFKIANIYNTREASGEPEAMNLQPLT